MEGEVELLERLARGKPRGLDPGLAATRVAAVGLGLQQRGGELLVAPLLLGPGSRSATSSAFSSARSRARELVLLFTLGFLHTSFTAEGMSRPSPLRRPACPASQLVNDAHGYCFACSHALLPTTPLLTPEVHCDRGRPAGAWFSQASGG